MFMFTNKQKILIVCAITFLSIAGYQMGEYYSEQRWIAEKARAIVQTTQASNKEDEILALRDYIRKHVRYEGLSESGRPFLRATAKETLQSGRGFCGEATRAFIVLARSLGIRSQRVNLYGRINHVVAEVELNGRLVLVDLQENPVTNSILDRQWWTVDEVLFLKESPWKNYSNIHLGRLPLINLFVRGIRLRIGLISWIVENPPLMKAILFLVLSVMVVFFYVIDRVFVEDWNVQIGDRGVLNNGVDRKEYLPSAPVCNQSPDGS
jgi:hypothetical protein